VGELVGPALVVLLLVVAGAGAYLAWRHSRQVRADLQRLADRDGLTVTDTPLGLGSRELAGAFRATPRGDRRYGIEYGVAGPLTVRLADQDRTVDGAAFRWWCERRRTSQNPQGHTQTSYQQERNEVALVRLPVTIPGRIVVRPESMFGQVGLTRGGQQLESSEFNRRFRVEGDDQRLVVQLLDAGVQHELLETFRGRSIELTGDLLVLGGDPSGREPGLAGFVGELPALRDDVRRLLAALPAAFWRAVGLPDHGTA
jgi:hypothetical protein